MHAPRPTPIYHITHIENLNSILRDGFLFSDQEMIDRGGPKVAVGMSRIKRRRLEELPVRCHPGDMVGEYVPFNFCPRSVMLFKLHKKNSEDLDYRGGQEPIIHLVADLDRVVELAEGAGKNWAFTLGNAAAYACEFRNEIGQLDEIKWSSVGSDWFIDPDVSDQKQAEFLAQGFVPWEAITFVGVHDDAARTRVLAELQGEAHQPDVAVQPNWYFEHP